MREGCLAAARHVVRARRRTLFAVSAINPTDVLSKRCVPAAAEHRKLARIGPARATTPASPATSPPASNGTIAAPAVAPCTIVPGRLSSQSSFRRRSARGDSRSTLSPGRAARFQNVILGSRDAAKAYPSSHCSAWASAVAQRLAPLGVSGTESSLRSLQSPELRPASQPEEPTPVFEHVERSACSSSPQGCLSATRRHG